MVATPFDAVFPGVEIHATVADDLLSGAVIGRPLFADLWELLSAIAARA